MNTQNDLEQLLAAAQRHHADERRQQRIADLVDQWAAEEAKPVRKVSLEPLPAAPSPRRAWGRIAAAVALLVAAGVMLPLLLHDEGVQVAQNGSSQTVQVLSHDSTSSEMVPEVPPVQPIRNGQSTAAQGRQHRELMEQPAETPLEPMEVLVAVAPVEEVPVEPIEVEAPPQESVHLAESVAEEPQGPVVIEITSTKLVCIDNGCRRPEPPHNEERSALPLMTLLKPLNSTGMHVNIYTFSL